MMDSSGTARHGTDLYETELPIRDDLLAAQRAVVDRWSRPGTWWTAAERLAIVTEVTADRNSLTRMQVELVAARTSKLNECFY